MYLLLNNNSMKKILFSLFSLLIIFSTNISFAWLQEDMLPTKVTDTIIETSKQNADSPLNPIFWFVKDSIFALLWIFAVWVFLYFWIKLISARWNPEEFKKVQQWFINAVIWLAIIPLALWLVKLISSLQF